MPVYDLYGKTLNIDFGNRGSKIIEMVKSGQADMGAAAISSFGDAGRENDPELRLIHQSRDIPSSAVYLSPQLTPADRETLRKVLLDAPEEIKKFENSNYGAGEEPNYDEFRKIIQRVNEVLICSDFSKGSVALYCPEGFEPTIIVGKVNGWSARGESVVFKLTQKSGEIYNIIVDSKVLRQAIGNLNFNDLQGKVLETKTPKAPLRDRNQATSDTIFVSTDSQADVEVGNEVEVVGTVREITPRKGNLSMTTIVADSVKVLSQHNPLPTPVTIGTGGRQSPHRVIDDDGLATLNPDSDGIDFYETLEGMRVQLQDAIAISSVNRFGEVYALPNRGRLASGLSARQTLTITSQDYNPERVQIQLDEGLLPNFSMQASAGDYLGNPVGVLSYDFGNYEVLATEEISPIPSGKQPEATNLIGDRSHLTVASYSVLNLDANDGDRDQDIAGGRFEHLADQIVNYLGSPDLLALQKIQDNSGSDDDGTEDASNTYQTLIQAIRKAGGPEYLYADDKSPLDNQDGGQPDGNIRV